MPSHASGLPARLVLGPALRAQSDRRLVRLVREGYESAFEEIVRRYRRPLDRFAASIVGGRSEDVTQDSFRKALEALRRDGGEIELRPWLYRIVRNTALNDLRDRPPAAAELAEDLMVGGRSAAAEAEQRAEVAAMTTSLLGLPENQRAALVMRELEGMSHEEIAATLGISGGAARQAIARGRAAVRGGLGALVPLPLLRTLASGGGAGTEEAAAARVGEAMTGAAGAGAAAGGAGAGLLGAGAGALKMGLATVVVAGGIGAGVAIDHHGGGSHHRTVAPEAVASRHASAPPAPSATDEHSSNGTSSSSTPVVAEVNSRNASRHGGRGDDRREAERSQGDDRDVDVESAISAEPAVDDTPVAHRGGGPGPAATSDGDDRHGDSQTSTGHGSGGGGRGSGHDDHQSGSGDRSGKGGGSGDEGGSDSVSGSSGSSSGGPGSDDQSEIVVEAPTAEPTSSSGSSSGGPGPSSSSSGDDGSGSSGGPSLTLDDSDSDGDSGSSGGPEISP